MGRVQRDSGEWGRCREILIENLVTGARIGGEFRIRGFEHEHEKRKRRKRPIENLSSAAILYSYKLSLARLWLDFMYIQPYLYRKSRKVNIC